jgi:hypothetical protein
MTLCPYCNKFQPTTGCRVPRCGGFVCPCSGRCNREEKFSPGEHAALDQRVTSQASGGRVLPRQNDADLQPDDLVNGSSKCSPADQALLADLRWHWDEAYNINCVRGSWIARFKNDTMELVADSADDLRKLIRKDYLDRTRSRQSGQTGVRGGTRVVGNGERALRALGHEGVI